MCEKSPMNFILSSLAFVAVIDGSVIIVCFAWVNIVWRISWFAGFLV